MQKTIKGDTMKSYVIISLAVALCAVLVFSGCKTGQGSYSPTPTPMASPPICGDGKVTGSEKCDTPGGYCDQVQCKNVDCVSYDKNMYQGGRLKCGSDCKSYNTGECVPKAA